MNDVREAADAFVKDTNITSGRTKSEILSKLMREEIRQSLRWCQDDELKDILTCFSVLLSLTCMDFRACDQ